MNLQNKSTSLNNLLEACRQQSPAAQKALYKHYYSYAMSICVRYATNKEEAEEVMNDGFLKIFTKLHLYDSRKPFQMWLRRIMINTSIDYYRRRNSDVQHLDVNQALKVQAPSDTLEGISAQEILKLVQELPPAYRMVFNLYAIEGYKHEEISNMLGIHIGTSKSNLSKARKYLQRLLKNQTVD